MAFESRRSVAVRPGPSATTSLRRVAALVFAIVQGLLGLRIVLLLLDARQTNGLVHTIINSSQVFVQPFEGILRENVVNFNGPALDAAATLALVCWTILEVLVIAALGVFRIQSRPGSEPASLPDTDNAPASETPGPTVNRPDGA